MMTDLLEDAEEEEDSGQEEAGEGEVEGVSSTRDV